MSTSIAKMQRYPPQPLETRFYAVKTYRSGFSLSLTKPVGSDLSTPSASNLPTPV